MKIKIPKKINLLGEVFEIKFDNNANCHGEIIFEDKTIKLDSRLKKNPDKLIWVFVHEISHFFHSSYYANHELDEDKGGEEDNEMFANALANFFFSIFKQVGDKEK